MNIHSIQHSQHGLSLAQVHAQCVREFAKAKGQWAKTDAIDAPTLAGYGQMMAPRTMRVTSYEQQELAQLVTRRRQLGELARIEKTRLKKANDDLAKQDSQRMLLDIKEEIEDMDARITTLIKNDESLSNSHEVVRHIRGIGSVTVAIALAERPELGRIGNRQISSVVGIAPHNVD